MSVGFSPGMQLGKYELGKQLGQGGFGVVMIARDTQLDREVAMKFLHAEHTANPEILRRFLQEARSAAKIVHPGIVTVFECGQISGTNTSADGVAYIAMEMLHGECLTDRLKNSGRLDIESAMEIGRQLASALDAAHRTGIVHRDLKPDNIFLVADPAMPRGERIKVLDFGIAKLAQSQQTSGVHTQSMMVFGTPRYMSPEQCRSAANIDHRSDIYALGCILFELVTGTPPFSGETGELIAKHQLVDPPDAREMFSDIPEGLDHLILSMLAKQPGDRPQSMADVQRALASGVPTTIGGPLTRSEPVARPPRRPATAPSTPTTLSGAGGEWESESPKRRKPALIAGGLAVVAIGAAVGWFALHGRSGGAATPAQPALPQAPQVAAAQPPAPPPPVKDIELKITSTPQAEVYLAADGRLLGDTPYTHTIPPGTGKIVFLVKADGYKDSRVTMAVDHDATENVALVAIKPAVATPPPTTPAAAKPGRPKPVRPTAATKPAKPAGSAPPPPPPPPKPPEDGMGGRI